MSFEYFFLRLGEPGNSRLFVELQESLSFVSGSMYHRVNPPLLRDLPSSKKSLFSLVTFACFSAIGPPANRAILARYSFMELVVRILDCRRHSNVRSTKSGSAARRIEMTATQPAETTIKRISNYVEKYRAKSGTVGHPSKEVTDAIVLGLAQNVEEVGRPLCPCNFYPDKQAEVDASREWVCACDEMKKYKYCHCLLFVNEDGMPITEYLPEGHEGREVYGLVTDPSPEKGREARPTENEE